MVHSLSAHLNKRVRDLNFPTLRHDQARLDILWHAQEMSLVKDAIITCRDV